MYTEFKRGGKMKYLKQFVVILLISFIGEILNRLIPLPIPASIYGIIILFVCLVSGILKKDDIKETSDFLIEIMPVMFIPAAVGILDSWDVIRLSWAAYAAVTILSTFAVMIISGHVTQCAIRFGRRRRK